MRKSETIFVASPTVPARGTSRLSTPHRKALSGAVRQKVHHLRKTIALIEQILASPQHVHKKVRDVLERKEKILFNEIQTLTGSRARTTVAPLSRVHRMPLMPAAGYDSDPSPRWRTPIWVWDQSLLEQFGQMLFEKRPKTAAFDVLFLYDYYLAGKSYQEIYDKYRLPKEGSAECQESGCSNGCRCGHSAKILKPKYDPRLNGTRPLQERRDYLCGLGYKWLKIAKPTRAHWRYWREQQRQQQEKAATTTQFGDGVDPLQFLDEKTDRHEVEHGQIEQVENRRLVAAERRWRAQNDPAHRRRAKRRAESARKQLSLGRCSADRALAKAIDLASRGKISQLAKHMGAQNEPTAISNDPRSSSDLKQTASGRFRGSADIMSGDKHLPNAA